MYKPEIGILNFDNREYAVSEPNDIYWYHGRCGFSAVLYLEDSVRYRDRFYTVCDDLSLHPIYGLRLKVRLSSYTNKTLEMIVCPIDREDTDVTDQLSDKARAGKVYADDILSLRDRVMIGLTLGCEHVDIESIYGVSKYIVKPDFVFVRYDVMQSDYYEEFSDGAFYFLREHGVLVIPLRNCLEKERWQYILEDVEETAAKAREEFLKMFVWKGLRDVYQTAEETGDCEYSGYPEALFG